LDPVRPDRPVPVGRRVLKVGQERYPGTAHGANIPSYHTVTVTYRDIPAPAATATHTHTQKTERSTTPAKIMVVWSERVDYSGGRKRGGG